MVKITGVSLGALLAVAAAVLPGCGSSDGSSHDAVTECKRLAVVECKKYYTCDSATQRADLQSIGTTESECESALIKDCPNQTEPCGPDETFDGDQADKCITARDTQTCAEYLADNDVPACETVCTSSGAGGATSGGGSNSGGGGNGGNGGNGGSGDNGAANGTDSVSECKRAHLIDCQKVFACFTAEQLASEADTFGTNVAECTDKLEASEPCATTVACTAGTYHADEADICVTQIGALTCDEFLSNSTPNPEACNLVCQ